MAQFAGQGWAGAPELGGSMYESVSHEALITQVKDLQRGDPHAKDQWAAYADSLGQGRRDPARHSAEFLSAFITHLQTGGKTPVSEESMHLVTTIKFMQKKSDGFKAAWTQFCKDFGGGTFDPNKHDCAFMISFFDYISSGQKAPAPMSVGSRAVANVMSGIVGESMPPSIMDAGGDLGAGQFDGWGSGNRNSSSGWVPTWASKSGVCGGGSGGYAGAPPAKRTRFDIVAPSHAAGGQAPIWGPSAAGEDQGTKEYLVAQVKNYQRMGEQAKEQWSVYADTYLGGVKDPNRHDASTLAEFVSAYEVPVPPEAQGGAGAQQEAGPMDATKESLVMRVKTFQKASKDNSELWRQFCGPTCDPARHTSERLQEFLTLYSVM